MDLDPVAVDLRCAGDLLTWVQMADDDGVGVRALADIQIAGRRIDLRWWSRGRRRHRGCDLLDGTRNGFPRSVGVLGGTALAEGAEGAVAAFDDAGGIELDDGAGIFHLVARGLAHRGTLSDCRTGHADAGQERETQGSAIDRVLVMPIEVLTGEGPTVAVLALADGLRCAEQAGDISLGAFADRDLTDHSRIAQRFAAAGLAIVLAGGEAGDKAYANCERGDPLLIGKHVQSPICDQ